MSINDLTSRVEAGEVAILDKNNHHVYDWLKNNKPQGWIIQDDYRAGVYWIFKK